MAGTRLCIHRVFLAQLLCLIVFAAYHGLRHDRVSRPLRRLFERQPTRMQLPPISLQPLSVVIGETPTEFEEYLSVQLRSSPHWNDVCHGSVEHQTSADAWICKASATPSWSVREGTVVVEPPNNDIRAVLADLFPPIPPKQPLTVSLATNRADWQSLATSLDQAFADRKVSDWPCFQSLATVIDYAALPLRSTVKENATSYVLGAESVEPTLADHSITLIVPEQHPVRMIDDRTQQSSTIYRRGSAVAVLVQDSVAQALDQALAVMVPDCMGLPNLSSYTVHQDGSFPSLYYRRWYQQDVSRRYQDAMDRLDSEYARMFNAPLFADRSVDWTAQWYAATDWLQQAHKQASKGHWAQASALLDQAEEVVERMNRGYHFLPVIDFPPEQYAAMFAPLLFPLLLPLLTGLRREVRRYRELQAKKEASNGSEGPIQAAET